MIKLTVTIPESSLAELKAVDDLEIIAIDTDVDEDPTEEDLDEDEQV